MVLDINVSSVVRFSDQLQKMHRSNFPIAVRETLNKAAFDQKQKTMPDQAKKAFIHRQKNFFKAFSKVEKAKGFEVNKMKAIIGFTENNLKGGNNYSVRDLEQQETGGRIGGKAFIPLAGARAGKSYSKLVRPANRISNIKNIVKANSITGRKRGNTLVPVKSSKEKFVLAGMDAGKGGHVMSNDILFRVDRIIRKKNRTVIASTPLYSYKSGRSVNVKRTSFMKKSSEMTARKLNSFYVQEARRRFERGKKV